MKKPLLVNVKKHTIKRTLYFADSKRREVERVRRHGLRCRAAICLQSRSMPILRSSSLATWASFSCPYLRRKHTVVAVYISSFLFNSTSLDYLYRLLFWTSLLCRSVAFNGRWLLHCLLFSLPCPLLPALPALHARTSSSTPPSEQVMLCRTCV